MNADIDAITEKIIGCAYRVSNSLGSGFLEKIYENSLVIELKKNRLSVDQQKPIVVRYDGQVVGDYVADQLVGRYCDGRTEGCQIIGPSAHGTVP